MTLEEQYLTSMGTARDLVMRVSETDTREALEAMLDAMSRVHMLLMQHQSETMQSLFDLKEQVDNVPYH
ncbi:MAG: hypothetical protein OEY97_06930 [Nitrospirota bacterium]|nr:hypothetical protein [Nitrospirota bacterium]